MPQVVTNMKKLAAGVLVLIALSSCAKVNPNSELAYFSEDTQKHADNWLPAGHKDAALADIASCAKCHGSDYSGGMSKVSCTACHIGSATTIHPDAKPDVKLNHKDYVASKGLDTCKNNYCHSATLTGVTGSGPSCYSCHTTGSTLPSSDNCTSCHGKPPSGGTATPNKGGAHATHLALPTAAISCSTCHNGSGSGTVNHSNGTVDVLIDSTFNAKSGTASYDSTANTCSKVSCHGGQTTPNWYTGTIGEISQTTCTLCHAYGTEEYNSYSSGSTDPARTNGSHFFHVVTMSKKCTDCHDTTKLDVTSDHFKYLDTTAIETGVPANTLITTPTCSKCHGWPNSGTWWK